MSLTIRPMLLAALVLLAGPTGAPAWDYPGHRIVGAIGDLVLARYHPQAYAKVMALIETKDAGGIVLKRTLSQVAVFADCAKKNDAPFCGRPPSDEEKAYAARNPHHDRFHYTDVPLQQTAYHADGAGSGATDVVHMIDYAVRQLAAKTADARPSKIAGEVDLTDAEAVWLLAHLVADVHQPLHVGAQYYEAGCETSVDPTGRREAKNDFDIGTTVAGTLGGNLIYLVATEPAVPPAANLHLYWDGPAVARAMRAVSLANAEAEFARLLAAAPPTGWRTAGAPDTWAAQWASEVLPLAREAHARLHIRKGVAPSPFAHTGGCTWTTTLDPAYEDWAGAQAGAQLAKAGFRLAALLAAIFE